MDNSFERSFKLKKVKSHFTEKDIIKTRMNKINYSEKLVNKTNDAKSIPPCIYRTLSNSNYKINELKQKIKNLSEIQTLSQCPLSKSNENNYINVVKLPCIKPKLDKVEEYFSVEVNIKDEILRRCKNRHEMLKSNSKSNLNSSPKISNFNENNHKCKNIRDITVSTENTISLKGSKLPIEIANDIQLFSNICPQDRIKLIRADIIKEKYGEYNPKHNQLFKRKKSIIYFNNKSKFYHIQAKYPLEQITPKLVFTQMVNINDYLASIRKDNEINFKKMLSEGCK